LQPVGPGALVAGGRAGAEAHAVAAFVALRPLAAVGPAAAPLAAQPVALAVLPLALVAVARRPRVNARHLKTQLLSNQIYNKLFFIFT